MAPEQPDQNPDQQNVTVASPDAEVTPSDSDSVFIPGRGKANAVLLLDAAKKAKLDLSVVRSTSDGYQVPRAVADKAFGKGKTSKE